MRRASCVLALVVVLPALTSLPSSRAQDLLPYHLPGGSTFTVPADYDTVTIIPTRWYRRFAGNTLELKIADEMIDSLKVKQYVMEMIIAEQDTITALTREGYVHYRDLWLETDYKLESKEIEVEKWKSRFMWGTLLTLAAGTVLGVALAN